MDPKARMLLLVDAASQPDSPSLPEETFQQIKILARSNDWGIQAAFDALSGRIKFPDAQVRLLAVKMIDGLFTRSRAFRRMVANSFQDFLRFSIGYDAEYPLPGPIPQSKELREQALMVVHRWNTSFGQHLKQIEVGYTYLKDVLKFKFQESTVGNTAITVEQAAREERSKQIWRQKYQCILESREEMVQDCEGTCQELSECLNILEDVAGGETAWRDTEEGLQVEWEGEEEVKEAVKWPESEEGCSRDVSNWDGEEQLGLSSYACDEVPEELLVTDKVVNQEQGRRVMESVDEALLETLRGLSKTAFLRLLPTMREWSRILIHVDLGPAGSPESTHREDILRFVTSTKSRLLDFKMRLEWLGIYEQALGPMKEEQAKSNRSKRDRTRSEMAGSSHGKKRRRRKTAKGSRKRQLLDPCAPKPGLPYIMKAIPDPDVRELKRMESEKLLVSANCPERKLASDRMEPVESKCRLPKAVRESLLAKAPVLELGAFQQSASNLAAPRAMQRSGIEIYNHWGKVDDSAVMPSERMEQLTRHKAVYYDPSEGSTAAKHGQKEVVEQKLPEKPSEPSGRLPTSSMGSNSLPKQQPLDPKAQKRAIREDDRRHTEAVMRMVGESSLPGTGQQVNAKQKAKKKPRIEKLKKLIFRK